MSLQALEFSKDEENFKDVFAFSGELPEVWCHILFRGAIAHQTALSLAPLRGRVVQLARSGRLCKHAGLTGRPRGGGVLITAASMILCVLLVCGRKGLAM